MLKSSSITVLSTVAATLLTAGAVMLLLSSTHGLREYASMVIWCSVGAGAIGVGLSSLARLLRPSECERGMRGLE
jgi:hypothetical protein